MGDDRETSCLPYAKAPVYYVLQVFLAMLYTIPQVIAIEALRLCFLNVAQVGLLFWKSQLQRSAYSLDKLKLGSLHPFSFSQS